MKTSLLKSFMLVCFIVFAMASKAQEADQTKSDAPKSADEIAIELTNPNTVLGTLNFNFDYVHYRGDLPGAGSQNSFGIAFQPSLPIPLSKTVNLYVRPNIPIIITQPTFNGTSFESQKVGLGNIGADIAVGKTFPSKFIGVIGGFASFRTASDEALRSPYTFIGPELLVAKLFKWGAAGIMVNHAWNVSKFDPNTATSDGIYSISNDVFINNSTGDGTAQITSGQYFYVVGLGKGWNITGSPTYSINHNAPKGEKVTFPIAAGASKVTIFGKLPVKFNLQYWYYVASPDAFGPQHQIRLTIAPVVPLPW